MKNFNPEKYILKKTSTLKDVISKIDQNKDGIALIVDDSGKLVGTLTDGDIRRRLLSNPKLDDICSSVMSPNPITGTANHSPLEWLEILKKYRLRNLPVLDEAGKPIGLANLADFLPGSQKTAVVMAGGEGKRLLPLTEKTPKPLLRVGDKAILEMIVEDLASAGIETVYITINYLADQIEEHFKDNELSKKIDIRFVREPTKLGTAGALSLLPDLLSPELLVLNADLITRVNFKRVLEFHVEHQCSISVAVTQHEVQIPYGVLNLAGHIVTGFSEKPTHSFNCSAGIYVINQDLIYRIPKKRAFDMTDLLQDTLTRGLPVAAFSLHEFWIDIGQKSDLQKARDQLAYSIESIPQEPIL